MRTRAWLLIAMLAACHDKHDGEGLKRDQPAALDPMASPPASESARPLPPVQAATNSDNAVPLPPAPADTLKLAAAVELPEPFTKLKPFMRKKDALALCAALTSTPVSADWSSYSGSEDAFTIGDGRIGALVFDNDRLVQVAVLDSHPSALVDSVHKAWGKGAEDTSEGTRWLTQIQSHFGAGAASWTADLSVYPGYEPDFNAPSVDGHVQYHAKPAERASLVFAAVAAPTKAESDNDAGPNDKFVAEAAAMIGSPLAAAQKHYGDEMRLESGDDDDDDGSTAESTAEKQGYVRMPTPWSSEPWEITLHVSTKTKKIDRVTLAGQVADDERYDLFALLKHDFGAPKPYVDDSGTIGIEYTSGRYTLHIDAGVESVTAVITPR